jgi:L-rhamnose mutarotase
MSMDRITFMMRVKDGCQEEYIRRHETVWPEVMAEHRHAGVTKMGIYMTGHDLFLYMEVDDYAKAVRVLNKSPIVLRWEEYMAPIMEASDDRIFDPKNPYPVSLPEVFFWHAPERHTVVHEALPKTGDTLKPSAPHMNFPQESSVES